MTARLAKVSWPEAKLPAGDPPQLGLGVGLVQYASAKWGTGRGIVKRTEWTSQWEAIRTLAGDLWRADPDYVAEVQRCWVMLTYAVGNFKRQGGTIIHPLPGGWRLAGSGAAAEPRDELLIPLDGRTLRITRDGEVPGPPPLREVTSGLCGTPTWTTLMAALWPGEHLILDVRDFRVAVALLAIEHPDAIANDGRHLAELTWADYRGFRTLMLSEADRIGVTLLDLERALFVAHDFVPRLLFTENGQPWAERGRQLLKNWQSEASDQTWRAPVADQ